MEKTIVVYYSRTGSNKYLAEKISQSITCDIEPIRPRINVLLMMLFFRKLGRALGNRRIKHKLIDYDRVILCGPIWMGQFICPLHSFINRYKNKINKLYFITCCGTSYKEKNGKFGHEHVFSELAKLYGDENLHCEALPIPLVIPSDKEKNNDLIMKTRLSDSNFTGEIQKRFEKFIKSELLN